VTHEEIPLYRHERRLSDVVAVVRSHPVTYEQFHRHIAEIAAKIQTSDRGTWIVACRGLYTFSVAFLAVTTSGREVVLCPHFGNELDLFSDAGVILDDETSLPGVPTITVSSQPSTDIPPVTEIVLDPTTRVHLYTSGSTGGRSRFSRPVEKLLLEVDILESLFGEELGQCEVLASVAPHHIYGLLFSILWPLRAGRIIHGERLFFPDTLATAPSSALLISTPAHLKRLVHDMKPELLREKLTSVFSSGGALPPATASALHDALGFPVIQIFGSTETGGVAWRDEGSWRPFPVVKIAASAEGQLLVQSPLLSTDAGLSEGWFKMNDRVVLQEDGTFAHQGRTDRLVKIAEQRISIDEVEATIMLHPKVGECRVIPITHNDNIRLAALVEPKGEIDERTLLEELKHLSRSKLPPLSRPRVVKVVKELPRDTQGKCTESAVRALLKDAPLEEDSPREPVVVSKKIGDASATLIWHIPLELAWCEGHFPQYPAVPGVVQVRWVLDTLRQVLSLPLLPTSIEALKFHSILTPDTECVLELSWCTEELKFSWSLTGEERRFSSGRIRCRE